MYYPAHKLVGLPLFDSVRAGVPADATQVETETLDIGQHLVSNPDATVLLSVVGDSMIDA